MEVDISPLTQTRKEKATITFVCNEFATYPGEQRKDGPVPVLSEEEEEFDCPTRTHRRRRAIRHRLKTGPNSMSKEEREKYQQLLVEQEEGGGQGIEKMGARSSLQQQQQWESRAIPAARACISVSVSPLEEEAQDDVQWAGRTLGGRRHPMGSSVSTSPQKNLSQSTHSSVSLYLPGRRTSPSGSPNRGLPRTCSVRSTCSAGLHLGSTRRAFVEPGPPAAEGGTESDWNKTGEIPHARN